MSGAAGPGRSERSTGFRSERRPSPMGGARPTAADLERFLTADPAARDDVLPTGPYAGQRLRMLIVGVNPSPWTAAVNAPFARPGNRFWSSLERAGVIGHRIDASRGLSEEDEEHLQARGIGITNLVGRATARADELSREELREGAARLVRLVDRLRPERVAVSGITAYRTAIRRPRAVMGRQDINGIEGWPAQTELWVVPQPSGLNAHETVDSLAAKWRDVWEAPAPPAAPEA